MGSKEGRGWCRAPTKKSQSLRSRRRVWARSLYLVPLHFPDLRTQEAGLYLLDVTVDVFWAERPKSACSLGPSWGKSAAGRAWGVGSGGSRAAAWDALEGGTLTRQVQG